MTMTTNTQRANSSRTDPLDVRSRLGHVRRRVPRRMGQWAAAVLFVAMVVIALVALFQSQSDRIEVLVATDSVPAGQVIERGDLRGHCCIERSPAHDAANLPAGRWPPDPLRQHDRVSVRRTVP